MFCALAYFYLSCLAWKNSKGDVYDKIEYSLAFLFLKGRISIAYECIEWCGYVLMHKKNSSNYYCVKEVCCLQSDFYFL